jgi:hypothetical protein
VSDVPSSPDVSVSPATGADPRLTHLGRQLLKNLGGSEQMVRGTPAALKRWGMEREDSILHVLPESLRDMVLTLPAAILDRQEHELAKEVVLTRQDRSLRRLLWAEYEQAHREAREMDLDAIATQAGAPSWDAYAGKFAGSQALLAWVMSPPIEYRVEIDTALERGIERLYDILELPLTDPVTKRVNTGVGLLILQAVKMLDQRRHGAYTQKNVNVNVSGGSPQEPGAKLDLAAIDAKLEQLEAELEGHRNVEAPPSPPAPVERVVDAEIVPG